MSKMRVTVMAQTASSIRALVRLRRKREHVLVVVTVPHVVLVARVACSRVCSTVAGG